MHVECTRHIDASEQDDNSMYEYYYEYDIYCFTDGPISFVARSYTDEPDEAHFLCIEEDGHSRIMVDADLMHPLLLAAQSHLRTTGKVHLRWLSGRGNGYEAIQSDPHRGT